MATKKIYIGFSRTTTKFGLKATLNCCTVHTHPHPPWRQWRPHAVHSRQQRAHYACSAAAVDSVPKKLIVDCGMLIVERSVCMRPFHASSSSTNNYTKFLWTGSLWMEIVNGQLRLTVDCSRFSNAQQFQKPVMRHQMELCGKNKTGGAR